MRGNEVTRSSTTPARQLHELNIQNRHFHLIEIKYCKDTRPGAQLVAGVQIKMPSIGGSQWEALSLMLTAERQA
eukprot:1160925-Pelagomonas_calceolata.AAC.3